MTQETQCKQFLPDAGADISCGQCTTEWNQSCFVTGGAADDYLHGVIGDCLVANGAPKMNPTNCGIGNTTDPDGGYYCPEACYQEWEAWFGGTTSITNLLDDSSPGLCSDAGAVECAAQCSL